MRSSCQDLVTFIEKRYRHAVEIGVGHLPDVGLTLRERGVAVFATERLPIVHDGLPVFYDDVTEPDLSLYRHVDVVYSVRPPPELVAYMMTLAETIHADLVIKPLSSEYADGSIKGRGKGVFFFWSFP